MRGTLNPPMISFGREPNEPKIESEEKYKVVRVPLLPRIKNKGSVPRRIKKYHGFAKV